MNALQGPDCCDSLEKQVMSRSILDNLKRRKIQKENELHNINAALKAMEANPSVTEVLELIAKA